MDSKDWFIIVNPSSGGGVSKAKLERISQCLKQNKIFGNIYETSLEKNAGEIIICKIVSIKLKINKLI